MAPKLSSLIIKDVAVTIRSVRIRHELDPYCLKMHRMTTNELSTSKLSKVIVLHTYMHTQRKTLPRRFAGGNKLFMCRLIIIIISLIRTNAA